MPRVGAMFERLKPRRESIRGGGEATNFNGWRGLFRTILWDSVFAGGRILEMDSSQEE